MFIGVEKDKRTYNLSNIDKQTIENTLEMLRVLRNHYFADHYRDITYYDYSVTIDLLKKILENQNTDF